MKDKATKICRHCGLPNTYPGIKFDKDNTCNYCVYFELNRNRERISRRGMKKEFVNVVKAAKNRKNKYDCIVAFSGGKDSSFLLYFLKKEFNLKILAYTFDNGFISETAKKNIKQVTRVLGIDCETTRPELDFMNELFVSALKEEFAFPKEILAMMSPVCAACLGMVFGSTINLAIRLKVPVMFIGFTPGQYPAISLENFFKVKSCVYLSDRVYRDDPWDVLKIISDPIREKFGKQAARYFFKSQYVAKGAFTPKVLFPFHVLIESGSLRKRKILQAAKLAKKLGAKIVGMGGLIASFAQGGNWLSEQIPDMGFTTGHAYTIGNIMEILDNAAKRVNIDISKATVAVVGAAGSIGSGCAKLLADRKPCCIILIDLNTFDALKKLEEVKARINKKDKDARVLLSDSFQYIKQADIVIVATNSVTSIIKKEHLKQGAIVIDDSFPKNVSERIIKERKDIILLEGGITRLPSSIDVLAVRNMPDLMDIPLTRLVSCKETYSCVAETLTLGLYGYKKNYGLGQSDPVLSKDIMIKARQRGFSSAPLQCFDEAVEKERFERVRELLKR